MKNIRLKQLRLSRFFVGKKMVGILIFIQIIVCILFSVSIKDITWVRADELSTEEQIQMRLDETIAQLLEQLDLRALQEYVDSLDVLTSGSVRQRLTEYIRGENFAYEDFFEELVQIFFQDVKNILPAFATIAAIALLAGVLSMLKSGTYVSTASDMIFLICYAAALIPLIGILSECFQSVYGAVTQMSNQMQIVYPILLTLMAASGGTMSAAICQPAVAFFSNTIVSMISTVVFPLTITIIVFSMASHLTKELKISKFSAFFKSINKWLIGVCVSVFGLFFTMQGITAATHDGIVRRAAKYAIGNGIPIVGGFLSGGFDLAVAGGILIKNALGSMSIFLMIAVLFKPLILLISVNIMLRFIAAVTQPFGDSRISDFLGETADNLHYCTAGLLFTAFMYFLSIVLIVSSSEALF